MREGEICDWDFCKEVSLVPLSVAQGSLLGGQPHFSISALCSFLDSVTTSPS